MPIDCVQESFLAAGDEEKSCCFFEHLDRCAERFPREQYQHEDSMNEF
jgi:hypothetical protein